MSRRAPPVVVLLLAACSRPAPPARDPSQADLQLQQVSVRSYSGGQLRVITTADVLDVYREAGTPGDLVARDAGVLLVRDGTRLQAPRVTGNFVAGRLEAEGGVRLQGRGGVEGRSPRVAFDRAQGTGGVASSDAGVWLAQPGFTLEATGFVMELAEEHATFEQASTHFTTQR